MDMDDLSLPSFQTLGTQAMVAHCTGLGGPPTIGYGFPYNGHLRIILQGLSNLLPPDHFYVMPNP